MPTPKWLTWLLLALPTLAAGGPLLGVGPIFAFRLAMVGLIAYAGWYWWRSRSLAAGAVGTGGGATREAGLRGVWHGLSGTSRVLVGLSLAFLLTTVISSVASRPKLGPAVTELIALGLLLLGSLALVAIYRGRQTVIALLRGWLLALVLVELEGTWELITGNRLPNFYVTDRGSDEWDMIAGPFHNPNQLAAFCVTALLLLPVGFALEGRARGSESGGTEGPRWLRWAYPAAALPLPILVYNTSSTLCLLLLVVIAGLWLLFNRRTAWLIPAGLVVLVALPRGRELIAGLWERIAYLVDTQDLEGYSSSERLNLVRNGWWMLEQSNFLGKGPGAFPDVMATENPPFNSYAIVNPHSGVLEILSQYGLLAALAVLAAFVLAIVMAARVLRATKGLRWNSPERAPALWLIVALVLWPALTLANSSWLIQSISTIHMATLALLARHVEAEPAADIARREDEAPLR